MKYDFQRDLGCRYEDLHPEYDNVYERFDPYVEDFVNSQDFLIPRYVKFDKTNFSGTFIGLVIQLYDGGLHERDCKKFWRCFSDYVSKIAVDKDKDFQGKAKHLRTLIKSNRG